MMLQAALLTTLVAALINTSGARVLKSDGAKSSAGYPDFSRIEGFEFEFGASLKISVTNLNLTLLCPIFDDSYPEIYIDDKWTNLTSVIRYPDSFLTVNLKENGVVKNGINFTAANTLYAFTLSFSNEYEGEASSRFYVEQVELELTPDSSFLKDDAKALEAFTDKLIQHLGKKVQEILDFTYDQNPAAAEKLSAVGLRQFRRLQNRGALKYLRLPKL